MASRTTKVILGLIVVSLGVFGISAASCTISPKSGWEYGFADKNCNVPSAILTVKRVLDTGDFFRGFLKEWDNNIQFLYVPNNMQKAEYNVAFTGLVTNLWYGQRRNSSSKLGLSLQGLLSDMWRKYKDESLSTDMRVKFEYLYFLTFQTAAELKGTVDAITRTEDDTDINDYASANGAFELVQSYRTINGKNYTIWHSTLYYLFSRNNSTDVNLTRRSRTLEDLLNFLEHQNRVVIVAPNGKHFAIRRHNNVYKVNRSNGTILENEFPSYDAAKQMIETCAVNTDVAPQYRAMCGFGSYGSK